MLKDEIEKNWKLTKKKLLNNSELAWQTRDLGCKVRLSS
jgi:hypothetical protein